VRCSRVSAQGTRRADIPREGVRLCAAAQRIAA
jgi:hypothetical protein